MGHGFQTRLYIRITGELSETIAAGSPRVSKTLFQGGVLSGRF